MLTELKKCLMFFYMGLHTQNSILSENEKNIYIFQNELDVLIIFCFYLSIDP